MAERVERNAQDHTSSPTPASVSHEQSQKVVLVSFGPNDPDNPFNWKQSKKWKCTLIVVLFCFASAINGGGYASAVPSMLSIWPGTTFVLCIGANTAHLGTIAIAPMFIAPISESLGRRSMFLYSAGFNFLMFIPQAVAPHIAVVYVARVLQGIAACAGNSLSGGLIADLFRAKNRGHAMAALSLFNLGGQAIGAISGGWMAQILGFRWFFWMQAIFSGIMFIAMIFLLNETRGSFILYKRAQKLTKETDIQHTAMGMEKANMKEDLKLSIIRPFTFLFTEPIVLFFSLWAGLIWGVLTMLYVSVPIVWEAYDFSQGIAGTTFVFMIIGSTVGFFTNFIQEHLYRKSIPTNGTAPPESRLYFAAIGAVIFPLSLFWYAWTARPQIHWISAEFALGFIVFAIYHIFLTIFTYLADVYEQYGSSALAAQSLLRNIFGAFFPLFAKDMYTKLGPPYASTMLACISLVFVPLPFILFAFGKKIRGKSRVAQQIKAQGAYTERSKNEVTV